MQGSLFRHKLIIVFLDLPRVMLTVAKAHLYPTWNLHYDTCKDEVGSPLW